MANELILSTYLLHNTPPDPTHLLTELWPNKIFIHQCPPLFPRHHIDGYTRVHFIAFLTRHITNLLQLQSYSNNLRLQNKKLSCVEIWTRDSKQNWIPSTKITMHGDEIIQMLYAIVINSITMICMYEMFLSINSLPPGRPRCHFKTAIFNLVLLIGIFTSSKDNALWWIPWDLTDDKSTLVQVMAWCHQAPAITRANVDLVLCRHLASPGHNELTHWSQMMHRYIHKYIRQWTGSSLLQVMARHLVSTKPSPEPILPDFTEHISMKFYLKLKLFHRRKCISICRLEMTAILFWSEYVKCNNSQIIYIVPQITPSIYTINCSQSTSMHWLCRLRFRYRYTRFTKYHWDKR